MTLLLSRRSALRLAAASAVTLAAPASLMAAPISYRLNPGRSRVGFGVKLGGDTLTGQMPVSNADLSLDFDNIGSSRVSVTLNAAATKMGVFFATEAVLAPGLLDTARHPRIQFQSTRVRQGPSPAEAIVDGNVTIRGVTRPVTLTTILTQDRATLGQENPELTLNLKGTVDRTDFGMTAYNGLVGPQVTLDIRASIKRG